LIGKVSFNKTNEVVLELSFKVFCATLYLEHFRKVEKSLSIRLKNAVKPQKM